MIKIDDKLLEELGLGSLPHDEKLKMVDHIYSTIELRVATRLAGELSEAKQAELGTMIDSGDEDATIAWLQKEAPNYVEIVAEELANYKTEANSTADDILSSIKK